MEGACECISSFEQDENMNPVDATMAMMSIAKDYAEDLEAIRQSSEISTTEIKRGLLEKIDIIFAALRHSSTHVKTIPLDVSFERYLLKHKVAGTSKYDKDFKLIVKCFRTLVSMYEGNNETFFDKLARGLDIGRALMREDDKLDENDLRWTELGEITGEMPKYRLSTAEDNLSPADVESILDLLDAGNGGESHTE